MLACGRAAGRGGPSTASTYRRIAMHPRKGLRIPQMAGIGQAGIVAGTAC